MAGIYVSQFASALGSVSQSVEDAAAATQLLSSADALRSAGFDRHHICRDDEDSLSLACRAFENSGMDPESIDAIVYSTCLPMNANTCDAAEFQKSRDVKHVMRFPASELQSAFGMTRAFIVGLNQQACTGMLGALRVARNFLSAEEQLANILCITADRFPIGAVYEQSYNLISDGAAACLVSRGPGGLALLDVHQITNGAMVSASDDETAGSYFNYTCRLVQETLDRNGLQMSDIRWVVPQNTNAKAWEILVRLLGVDGANAYFPSMASTGHVISADNVINLAALVESGATRRGDRILTFMAGYGSNWQCALLEAS